MKVERSCFMSLSCRFSNERRRRTVEAQSSWIFVAEFGCVCQSTAPIAEVLKTVSHILTSCQFFWARCADKGHEVSNGMQIRITIRLSPVKPIDPVQIRNVFRQIPCRVGHHEEKIELSKGRVALRCLRCGWESPGWNLDSGRRENQNVLARQTTVHLGQPKAFGL
jgi:hypothetical protein